MAESTRCAVQESFSRLRQGLASSSVDSEKATWADLPQGGPRNYVLGRTPVRRTQYSEVKPTSRREPHMLPPSKAHQPQHLMDQ